MGKPHKHAELIKAWADGAEIQFKFEHLAEWQTLNDVPRWDERIEYRIKPEPEPERSKDTELLANLIRSFGYTTWGQSYELATAILQKVGAK